MKGKTELYPHPEINIAELKEQQNEIKKEIEIFKENNSKRDDAIKKLEEKQEEFWCLYFTRLKIVNISAYLVSLIVITVVTFSYQLYTFGILISAIVYFIYLLYLVLAYLIPQYIAIDHDIDNVVSTCTCCNKLSVQWINCFVTTLATLCVTIVAQLPFGKIDKSLAIIFYSLNICLIIIFIFQWMLSIVKDATLTSDLGKFKAEREQDELRCKEKERELTEVTNRIEESSKASGSSNPSGYMPKEKHTGTITPRIAPREVSPGPQTSISPIYTIVAPEPATVHPLKKIRSFSGPPISIADLDINTHKTTKPLALQDWNSNSSLTSMVPEKDPKQLQRANTTT